MAIRAQLVPALTRYCEVTGQQFSISAPDDCWIQASLAFKRKDKGIQRGKASSARSQVMKLLARVEALAEEWPDGIYECVLR